MMISHEIANRLAKIVYRGGIGHTKSVLSEQVRNGDRVARQLLNSVGLFEQKKDQPPPAGIFECGLGQTYSVPQIAGMIRLVLDERKRALLADQLVCEMIEHGLSVPAAVQTLIGRELLC